MGINIKKKDPVAETPAPVVETPPAKKAGGITIGGKKPSVAEVLHSKPVPEGAVPKAPATATVTKDNTTKGVIQDTEQSSESVIAPPSSATVTDDPQALCRVTVEASYTHNLGNYNSTRIGISLSVPCKHDEIGPVFDFAEGWCNERMTKSVAGLQGGE